tara:strand:- start:204 stop:359 length:156 start_codon:yes stop_codon:yes gene_type:complete
MAAAAADAAFVCCTPGCGKPASMVCPKCKELNIHGSFFCNQTCFKGYWSEQ